MSVVRSVVSNTVTVYLGKIVGIIISATTLGIIARNLGVEGFGAYSTVLAYSAIVVAVADLGIGWLATREIALGKEDNLKTLATLKIIVTVLVIGGSLAVLPLFSYSLQVQQGVFLVMLFTYLSSMNSLQVGILQGKSRLGKTAIADTVSRVVNLCLAWLISYYGYGVHAQLLALNLVGATIYFINALMIRQAGVVLKGFQLKGLGLLKKDLLTMPAVVVLSFMVYRIDMLILANLAPSLDVGIYAAAYRIIDVVIAIPAILVGTLLPVFTQAIHDDNPEQLQRIFRFGYNITIFLGGLATVACFSLASLAVRVIVGPDFIGLATVSLYQIPITSIVVLQILSFFLFLSFIGSLLSGVILAAKRQTIMIWVGIVGLLITVIGNSILIPRISYAGSALLTVFTEVCIVICMLISMRGTGWLREFWVPFGRTVLVTFLAFLVVLMLPTLGLWSSVLGMLAYCGLSLLFLSGRDWDAIKNQWHKLRPEPVN